MQTADCGLGLAKGDERLWPGQKLIAGSNHIELESKVFICKINKNSFASFHSPALGPAGSCGFVSSLELNEYG